MRAFGGSDKYATVADAAPVYSLFSYVGSAGEKFFAADETNIFDISSISDEDTIPTGDVTGQTSGLYSTAQMVTAGGSFLYAVNGTDKAQLYDGTDWAQIDGSSSPIAITGVTTSDLSFVWPFAQRLFFIQKGTLSAWYLPVNSIGGAAGELSLLGVFQNGGSLLFGGSWSLDSGSGLDDKCVFVTDQGEVAVYEGTDPSSADAWQKVGVYQISQPKGKNGSMRAGGDLLIATEDGVVPLSEAVRKDVAALSLAAVSRAIEPDWKTEAASRTLPWEILKWSSRNMMIISQPRDSDSQMAQALICNLETGAWCRRTGWDTRCLGMYNGQAYFGTNDGRVMQMDVGGNDDGDPYTCIYVGQFDHLRSPGYAKTVMQGRATFRSTADFLAKLSVTKDYSIDLPTPPNSIADYTVDEWDVGKWDEAKWDANTAYSIFAKWTSIGKTGAAIAPVVQATFGITPKPNLELVAIDITYIQGELVV
jgi:hypothetical protein